MRGPRSTSAAASCAVRWARRASFGSEADAQAFAGKNGGKVLRFDQITIDMVSLDGGVIRDEHGSGDKR